MATPQIDPNWSNDDNFKWRPFLAVGLPILLLLSAIAFSFCKGSKPLDIVARPSVYEPDPEGFVGKANNLFANLLAVCDTNVKAIDLATLNERYPALEFALPYEENSKTVIEAADIRVVAVHPEHLSEEDRNYYYNSRLPQMLRQQAENLCETYFHIVSRSVHDYDRQDGRKPIEIKSISLQLSMFKLALSKDPWKGTIYANPNCLFSSDNAIFLTYGNSMVPLPIAPSTAGSGTLFKVVANTGDSRLYKEVQNKLVDIDYYELYEKGFKERNGRNAVEIELVSPNSREPIDKISIICTRHGMNISSGHTNITAYQTDENGHYVQTQSSITGGDSRRDTLNITDGMKLVFSTERENETRKVAEFCIHLQDPTNVLSDLITTNKGKSRYNLSEDQTDLFTQQVIRGLSRHLSNQDRIDSILLSIDPMLSREFEKELKQFTEEVRRTIDNDNAKPRSQQNEMYDISLTIMDMSTGDILASPFYSDKFKEGYPERMRITSRNPALSRRYLGSTFKPILALAAVQANPNLLNLDTRNNKHYLLGQANDPQCQAHFLGYKTGAWARKSSSHWAGTDFTNFIMHSDDVYPVALAALAMTGQANVNPQNPILAPDKSGDDYNNFFTTSGDYIKFKKKKINYRKQPFTSWLAHITGANYDLDENTDQNLFEKILSEDQDEEARRFGLSEVNPDITNLNMQRFNRLGDKETTDFQPVLVPWVLGQGDNEWSCIAIAQAWSRMLTKHKVRASMVRNKAVAPEPLITNDKVNMPGCNTTTGEVRSMEAIDATWDTFLAKFNAAQAGGTLVNMNNAINEYNASHPGKSPLKLFSKTGTPDAVSRYEYTMLGGNNRYYDIGLYTFGLMTEQQYNRVLDGETPKGIVCVVRITRTYVCPDCMGETKCSRCDKYWGVKSSHAQELFTKDTKRLRKLLDMTSRYF